jgi:hypothetical protein
MVFQMVTLNIPSSAMLLIGVSGYQLTVNRFHRRISAAADAAAMAATKRISCAANRIVFNLKSDILYLLSGNWHLETANRIHEPFIPLSVSFSVFSVSCSVYEPFLSLVSAPSASLRFNIRFWV